MRGSCIVSGMRKSLTLKDVTSAGEVQAVVATLNVIDSDGDVTLQGFFGKQPTRIVQAHDWSNILLGKGTVDDGDGVSAIFGGQFNLDDPDAEKLFTKLRFDMEQPPPMIEWSYGFGIEEGGAKSGDFQGRSVRFLQPKADGAPGGAIHEVSPVLLGAGQGTGTLAVKDAGIRFADELASVKATASSALERAKAIAQLRKQDGRELSEESIELLGRAAADLGSLAVELGELVTPKADDPSPVEEEPEPEPLGHQGAMLQAQYEHLTRS